MRSIIRASAFLRKEIAEVIRQPRLILTLVLGPFLILFVFGIGYRNEARAVRTVFVADPNGPFAQQIRQYATTISPQLIFSGIQPDQNVALSDLRQGKIDLVAVIPQNAFDTIKNNQQAIVTFYHNEIDPAQASYMDYLGQLFVDEVNRRVLTTMASQGQTEASDLHQQIQDARSNVTGMRQAIQAGNSQSAQQYQQRLAANIDNLSLAAGMSAGLLTGIEQNTGSSGNAAPNQDVINTLKELQSTVGSGANNQTDPTANTQTLQRLDKADQNLANLDQQLADFRSISPTILVRPFGVQSHTVAQLQVSALDFFTPSVIVLLLQHIGVTIAALSIVRERRSGAMELFRISPVSSLETMVGKYVSYLIFGILIAAVLSALIYFGLHVPMLGSWVQYGLVCLLLLFAALGLGFVISLVAETESQAVQLAMIALLMSVFFSGFFLDLRYFFIPVRVISYLIPATYGIILLQNIMLRGSPILTIYAAGLLAIGIILFLMAWMMLRRRMATR